MTEEPRLSIGEFAGESGLSTKALRLYDELGLLPPARVDPHTGYRFYNHSQLAGARLIVWLRGLGMPLERIRLVLGLPPAAAAVEVGSYWRQVEADTAARREIAAFLVDHLSGEDGTMTGIANWALRSASALDGGLVREDNQDALFEGRNVFAVADGYGGGAGAPAAGALGALGTLDDPVDAGGDPVALLAGAVESAGIAVREHSDGRDCGTTLTAMVWTGPRVALAHVGDSRAYLLREGTLRLLTHDHTFVQSLVDEAKLTPEEAAAHPRRATLLRSLHGQTPVGPDLHVREARAGDRYLLCTDGLHAVLAERDIARILGEQVSPGEAVERLVAAVREAGAPDNVACVVVEAAAR